MSAAAVKATQSATTAASNAFVAAHMSRAVALGGRLAELISDPDAFVEAVRAGLAELADPAVVDGIHSVTPGLGSVLGVRLPLLEAVHKQLRWATKRASTAHLLDVTDRLLCEEAADVRWFGMWNLERLLATDPERTWQLMRRAAAEAGEWISVDTLAHPYGAGILREPRRWSELQQLVYSPSRWERRLVGSTLATMPHVKLPGSRDRAVVANSLALVRQLIGDNEPDVQKALSWALRTLADLDSETVVVFLETETTTARDTDDGSRAWVIRDSLSKIPSETAARLRSQLEGVKRRSGAQSTSLAAAGAAQFATTGAAPRPVHSHREE
jgi:3-methyladenine DNA glycosylase AlkD